MINVILAELRETIAAFPEGPQPPSQRDHSCFADSYQGPQPPSQRDHSHLPRGTTAASAGKKCLLLMRALLHSDSVLRKLKLARETGGDEMGGEMSGGGAQSSAAPEVPPSSRSQSRRRYRRRGQAAVSQQAPESDEKQGTDVDPGIDVDLLIEEVREREPLWNMADRRHSDKYLTRRLWLEVCHNVISNWEDLSSRQQTLDRK
ncbi:uncharacterized protein LOC143776537 [Ranitomeya variabilis]|uniref:uncharacterized protein LOC143776537 n=1 Tax=Ranitomeya variabilis TaxID=490064 RepID=UPI004055AFE5